MKQDTQKKEKSISKKDISEKVTHREAAAVQEASKEIVSKDITHRKTLQELTLKDNFLFAAVMIDPENCRQLLELALKLEIECVEVDTEKSIVYHPEYKGVRLDVYAKDEHHTRFNVEMQVARQTIEKRVRYYHSQMDMELILAGTPYEELSDCYVLFLCDFDPFGVGKYRYTLKNTFVEDEKFTYNDGSHTVFLSTKGKNADEVPEQLVSFLKYAAAELDESTADFGDEFVVRLQKSVKKIKADREIGGRYMLFEELLRNEHREGFTEGMEQGLTRGMEQGKAEAYAKIQKACASMPEDIRQQILSAMDNDAREITF